MEEKRIAKEKAEKAANELQKMARAATVIQVKPHVLAIREAVK